jgi:enolase
MKSTNEKVKADTGVINSMDLLRKELGLTDDQYRKVLVENDRTTRTYNIVFDMLCETNVAMIEELAKTNSDPAVLDSLSRKVGTLSTSLRRHTTDYFMNLKGICNEEQQQRLTLIFKSMMQLDEQCKTCNKKDCPRKERINNIGK